MEHDCQHIEGKHYDGVKLLSEDYSECILEKCSFNDVIMEDVSFCNCTFKGCAFRNVTFIATRFQSGLFIDCSLIGIDWSEVRRASSVFPLFSQMLDCTLKYNSFVKMKLPKMDFTGSSLLDCDFMGCDLTGAFFVKTDLEQTTFHDCTITKGDFRGARNYVINPAANRIRKGKFSLPDVVGLLGNLDIVIE